MIYLDVDTIVAINAAIVTAGSSVRDLDRIDAAAARPRQAFDGVDFHPSVWDKAAVLLQGLASTQGFIDGNKRTAWEACETFLNLNDQFLAPLPTVAHEAFVLTVATGLFSVEKTADWLREHNDRRQAWTTDDTPEATSTRVESYWFAAQALNDQQGLINMIGSGWVVYFVVEWPDNLAGYLSALIRFGSSPRTVRAVSVSATTADGTALDWQTSFLSAHEEAEPATAMLIPFNMVVPETDSVTFRFAEDGQPIGSVKLPIRLRPM